MVRRTGVCLQMVGGCSRVGPLLLLHVVHATMWTRACLAVVMLTIPGLKMMLGPRAGLQQVTTITRGHSHGNLSHLIKKISFISEVTITAQYFDINN